MEELRIEMPDGSVYRNDNETWLKALTMKLNELGLSYEDFEEQFKQAVQNHWDAKTVPTKFSFDISWEEYFGGWPYEGITTKEAFDDMADLADKVLYQYLRAYILGVVLSKSTKGKSKVIAITEDGLKEIDDKGVRDVETGDFE